VRTRDFGQYAAGSTLVGAVLVVVVMANAIAANASTDTHRPFLVAGNGMSTVPLGESQSTALARLISALGSPTTAPVLTPDLANCGVGVEAQWRSMTAYFNHSQLVGLSFGPGRVPDVRTSAGLTLGTTVARARALYGARFTTSNAQGGVWFLATSRGLLRGFLIPSTAKLPTPHSRIHTIDVGVVGCPAMSP
jgi:hypothetical protein